MLWREGKGSKYQNRLADVIHGSPLTVEKRDTEIGNAKVAFCARRAGPGACRREGGLLRMNNDVTVRARSGSDMESDRTSGERTNERTNVRVLLGHELAHTLQRASIGQSLRFCLFSLQVPYAIFFTARIHSSHRMARRPVELSRNFLTKP